MPARVFSVSFPTVKSARAAFHSLSLETGQAHEKKAQTTVRVKNNRLVFAVVGRNAKTIRASTFHYNQMANYLKKLE
jgi:tRNA threonylcarbamoyladenosine modification (KEOPS) complex  Pcc1 subunit